MLRKNFLSFLLILLIGFFLGILFSKYIVPQIELFLTSKIETKPLVEIPLAEKETQIFCQKIRNGIEVETTKQVARLCEDGKAVEEFSVSTGTRETPTPTGEFFIIKKSSMIYSKIADSWLPFWVGFYEDYGFHELPIDKEGKRVGEGEIGRPASLGCVRLKVGDAETLYQFAKDRMRVVIFGETP